ncbi:MAG: helix-turn-helix domain-containing protein [Prevotella sp.]|jgi:AraC-like DNA-binding protein
MKRFISILLFSLFTNIIALCAPIDSLANIYKERGVADMLAQRFPESFDNFVKGMDLSRKSGDVITYTSCLANMASIYAYTGNLDRALYYQKKAYDLAVSRGDSVLRAEIVVNLVGTYCQMGDLQNAKRCFVESNRVGLKDVKLRRYYFLYNQALISRLEGNEDMACYYHRQAADYALENGFSSRAVSQYVALAGIYLTRKQPQKALASLAQAKQLAQSNSMPLKLVDIWKMMSKTYKALGNQQLATDYATKASNLSDSLFQRSQMNRAENHLFDYENRINDESISSLTSALHKNRLALVFFIILVMVMTISIIIISINLRKLRKARLSLIARNEELTKNLEIQYHPNDIVTSKAKKTSLESSLGTEQTEKLRTKILEVMNNIDIITRPDFSLVMLAELTDSNTTYVSKVINESFGKNFRAFLNEYRIREACVRLADSERYGNVTIQTIYQNLGYSSAGGFIEAFKKINGMSPSVYQKLAKSRKSERNS